MLQQQGSQLFLVQLDELLLLIFVTVDILALTHALSVVHHVIAGLIVHLVTIHVLFILCPDHHLVLSLLHLVIHLIIAVIVLITILVILCISVIASLLILVHLLLIIVILVLLVDHLLLGVVVIVLLISCITHFLAAVFLHLNLAGLLHIDLRFVVLREVGGRSIKLIVVVGRDQKLPLLIR